MCHAIVLTVFLNKRPWCKPAMEKSLWIFILLISVTYGLRYKSSVHIRSPGLTATSNQVGHSLYDPGRSFSQESFKPFTFYCKKSSESGKRLYSTSQPLLSQTTNNAANLSKMVLGLAFLKYIDKYLSTLFRLRNIQFPSSLGGMIGIFSILTSISVFNSSVSNAILEQFMPALSFMRVWLALFFIPPLVVLPLKYSLLSKNASQLISVIVVGFIGSLMSSGIIAELFGRRKKKASEFQIFVESQRTPVVTSTYSVQLPSPLPFIFGTVVAIAVSYLSKVGQVASLNNFYRSSQILFGLLSTIASFLIANKWVPTSWKKVAHPVLTCAVLSMGTQYLGGAALDIPFTTMLSNYYGFGTGPGDSISSMLGPAIVCFGIQLYQYRNLLVQNSFRVLFTTFFSALFGLVSSSYLAKLVGLKGGVVSSSLLTRCITSPLALAGARLTGADPTLSALIVVVTGLLGGSFGSAILKNVMRVNDDVSIGLSIGASAHGLGAASVASEPAQFSAAIVSMTLTGLFTVILLSVEKLRFMLL